MDRKKKKYESIIVKGVNPENDSRNVVMREVDEGSIDTTERVYQKGSTHVQVRSKLPEAQLFSLAEYHYQDAERTGYSQYSYWKSVWQNFLKNKSAVMMLRRVAYHTWHQ